MADFPTHKMGTLAGLFDSKIRPSLIDTRTGAQATFRILLVYLREMVERNPINPANTRKDWDKTTQPPKHKHQVLTVRVFERYR